jgi:hypothetical protein
VLDLIRFAISTELVFITLRSFCFATFCWVFLGLFSIEKTKPNIKTIAKEKAMSIYVFVFEDVCICIGAMFALF